jgi:hypothetical protein
MESNLKNDDSHRKIFDASATKAPTPKRSRISGGFDNKLADASANEQIEFEPANISASVSEYDALP